MLEVNLEESYFKEVKSKEPTKIDQKNLNKFIKKYI